MIDLYFGFGNNFSNFFTVLIPLFLIGIGIWLWALIDCLSSNKETMEKLLWVLIIIVFSFIGAIVYLIISSGKNENILTNTIEENKGKRLYRSRKDSIIGGVCGGIGNYFNIDPVFVRLIFVLLFLLRGSGILIYIVAWIIIPLEPRHKVNEDIKKKKEKKITEKRSDKKSKSSKIGLVIFFIIFGLFIFTFIGGFMFYDTFKKASFEFKEVFEERVIKDDRTIVQEIFEYDIENMKHVAKNRILNDYNYITYNGNNLRFLGLKTSNECETQKGCYELFYTYDIETENLPNIEGFEVNFLFHKEKYINVEFIEISRGD